MGVNLGPPPAEMFEDRYRAGTEVWYLPHICHAFNCNSNNEYPWVFGMKQSPRYQDNPRTGEKELIEEVIELDEGYLHRVVLPAITNSPDPLEQRKRLVPLRPRKPWRAVVTRTNPDGTLDIDAESNIGNGMTTLHYTRVPIDESRASPHSCHKMVCQEYQAPQEE